MKTSELSSFSHAHKLRDIRDMSPHVSHTNLKHPFAENRVAKDNLAGLSSNCLYKQKEAAELPLLHTPF